jgi:HSP20 family protein
MKKKATKQWWLIPDKLLKGTWAPTADIYETDDSFRVEVDLPGVNKDDIRIDLEDNTLTIQGEKKFEEKASRDNYLTMERAYGIFVRSFTLPQNVDADNIKAKYQGGVLELTIPKKEDIKSKQPVVKVTDDPIFKLGSNPIERDVEDASESHDKYI